MKIAILSCLYPYRGGIAQFNASMLTTLGKTHSVRAFNFSRQYPDFLFPGKTQYVTPDDEAVPVESERVLDTVNPISWVKTACKIKEWGPDILIIRYWMSFLAPSLGFVARRMPAGCKVIAIMDNVVPHEQHFFDTPLTRYFLSGIDGCVTLSEEVGKDLDRICPGKRRTVLPHPIYSHFGTKLDRAEAEAKLGLKTGLKTLLFFGLIRDYKGLDILIEAFDRLDSSYQLLIAGEPYGSFEKYNSLISHSPGRDRIHVFTRYIKDSEVKDYFSAADLAVLPYRSATQSGISNISYHFEVPMVVTDVGGLRSTIGELGTGLIAPAVTPGSVAETISRYFADASVAEHCKECIRAEKDRLSWDRLAEGLISFSQEIKA